jgi:tetratricopeptide (TPR) repeat protein
MPPAERADWQRAVDDSLAAQRWNADEPGAQVNLGNYHAARGDYAAAEAAYREALALNPDWVPAYVNLSDGYRRQGRDGEGERLLREGLARLPKSAAPHHSLGLLLVRQKKLPEALASLNRATELAPDETRFRYVYAVALYSAGQVRAAKAAVAAGLKRRPGDPGLNQLRAQWE